MLAQHQNRGRDALAQLPEASAGHRNGKPVPFVEFGKVPPTRVRCPRHFGGHTVDLPLLPDTVRPTGGAVPVFQHRSRQGPQGSPVRFGPPQLFRRGPVPQSAPKLLGAQEARQRLLRLARRSSAP